jgi:hypothetical protein
MTVTPRYRCFAEQFGQCFVVQLDANTYDGALWGSIAGGELRLLYSALLTHACAGFKFEGDPQQRRLDNDA